MGALRAAELSAFGMIGIGRVFRLFRSGLWSDDDEIAVIHASEELDYCPLSETMANVRFTLRRLRRSGSIDREIEAELVRRMKARHFSRRTGEALLEEARSLVGGDSAAQLLTEFESRYVDIKRLDARALLAYISQPNSVRPRPEAGAFPATGHWRHQFEASLTDVPLLR
jgi:hypothetical protein